MRAKRIEEFPNYAITNDGRVWSIKSHKWLKLTQKPEGYLQVHLSSNGGAFYRYVHRLVAEAFIPNPENKPECDHIDRDKTNNNVSNLRWATRAENCANRDYSTKYDRRRVCCQTTGLVFDSAAAAARYAGVYKTAMCRHLKGLTKSCGGKVFTYID